MIGRAEETMGSKDRAPLVRMKLDAPSDGEETSEATLTVVSVSFIQCGRMCLDLGVRAFSLT